MKIFINAGHCVGKDSGAVGFGITEAEKVLKIGKAVEKYLSAAGCDTRLVQLDSLQGICDASNNWQADYFVSIHCNAANTNAQGTETYCYRNSVTGKKFANAVHNSMIKKFPELLNRGVKEAGFYVLAHTDCPAILVETAFIDNAHDNKILVEREDDFARAIAVGITDFLQKPNPDVIDKPTENFARLAVNLYEKFKKICKAKT